ncbi:MAG: hypothetical protein OEY14_18760, partial [Myxococcales bacterium]|nr:hypothetical protein [Myxococcales bacterium]
LGHEEDPDALVALLRETGILYEERLRAADTAFERYLQAFAVQPMQEVVRDDVVRVAEAVKGWDRVVEAYGAAIEGVDLEDDAIVLRIALGEVLKRIERVEEAIAQYRAVYDLQNDHAVAIEALAELYQQTEKYAELLEIFERRIELEDDVEARRAMAHQRAALLEGALGDAERAIDAYRGILEEYGEDEADAMQALDRLYEGQERWSDLAQTLERRVDLGPESDEALVALKYRLGRVLEQHLEEKPRAVELYQEVLTIHPEHEEGRASLEELLADPEVGVSAARILEPLYEGRGDWEMLVRALRVLHDGAEEDAERLELLTKTGEIYSTQIEDPAKAFDVFCEALRGSPSSHETVSRLELLAVEHERFKDLVALIAELAAAAQDADLARTLWLKAAQIHELQLEDVEGAVASYSRILDADPSDVEVLAALENLYRRTERWRDLVSVIRRRVEQSMDPVEQEELLAQMATIYDAALEEPAEAIGVYKEVLELDPESERALAALDGLYERLEMWTDLADNVDRQLGMAADPERQIELMIRLADLRETRMSAVESAIQMYSDVLDREPQNEAALGALERLVATEEHQLVVAEILEPLYREASEFEKLIGVHEIQAAHAASPDRRVELLHQIAELYEVALDRPEESFQSFSRALTEDPANPSTQEQLERLARAIDGAEALAQVYEARVQ